MYCVLKDTLQRLKVRRARRLVLSFIATVVNYEYIFRWSFLQVRRIVTLSKLPFGSPGKPLIFPITLPRPLVPLPLLHAAERSRSGVVWVASPPPPPPPPPCGWLANSIDRSQLTNTDT